MSNLIDVTHVDFNKCDDNTVIAVDTNILLFVFYQRISYTDNQRFQVYQNIFEKIAKNLDKIKLVTSAVNINEAFNVIEKTEYDIYKKTITDENFSIKDYRRLPDHRTKLKKEFKSFWKQVCTYMNVCDYTITKSFLKQFSNNVENYRYDCLDAALVDFCQNENITKIITDDSDYFGYKNGIDILTANPSMARFKK